MSADVGTDRINSSLRQSYAGQTIRIVGKPVDSHLGASAPSVLFEDNLDRFPVNISSCAFNDWQDNQYFEIIGTVQQDDGNMIRAHDACPLGTEFGMYFLFKASGYT